MSPEVATLRENDRLLLADDVMRLGRIRHLPVVDADGGLVGIVSQRDLFRGSLDVMVLAVLADGRQYGYAIQKQLKH